MAVDSLQPPDPLGRLTDMKTPAVLLLWFNRPDLAHRQILSLRTLRPPVLFLAADGPRADRSEEPALCARTREVRREIDWPCTVQTLFRSENLGVRRAVSGAIDWFFSHVDEGVILEDDCLPAPEFFGFAAGALERYRDEPRVMHVSGTNFLPARFNPAREFVFSRYASVWGWATWRRAWQKFRGELEGLDRFYAWADRSGFWDQPKERKYWRKILGWNVSGRVNSWAYRWNYTLWAEDGLAVTPAENLVSNVGFDDRATNTSRADGRADRPWGTDPGQPPEGVARDAAADRWVFRHLYWGTPAARLAHRLDQLRGLLAPSRPPERPTGGQDVPPDVSPQAG